MHALYRRQLLSWGVALGLILATASAANASNVLRYMPEDALGFVLVRNLEDVDAKVGRFTQLFGLNFPAPLTFAKLATGLDEGLQGQGELLVALLPGSNEPTETEPMVLLPVDDYAKFAASIQGDASGEVCRVSIVGEAVLVAKFGEYALLMNVEHRETLEMMLSLQQAPVAALKPLDPWLDKNDVTFVLMPAGLETLLELGKQTLVKQHERFTGDLGEPQFSAILKQMEMNAKVLQWMLDFFEAEVELVAVAINLDENINLRVSERVLLKEGGKLSEFGELPVEVRSPLAGFVDQPFVAVGGGPLPKKWAEAIASMSRNFMERMPELYGLEELDSEQWEKLEGTYFSMMRGMESSSMIIFPGKEGEPLFSNVFGIMKTADAEGYLESYSKAIELWNEIMATSTSDIALQYDVTSKTVANKKACEIVVDVASAAQDPNVPAFKGMLEAMFGEEGKMHQLLVAANKQTLVYGMAKEEQLIPVIEAVEADELGLAESPDVQLTVKLSSADAPWRLYVSPQGCVHWAKRIMNEFLTHLAGVIPEIPDFDTSPPVGLTINLIDERIEADLVCPAETLKALAVYIEKCKAL